MERVEKESMSTERLRELGETPTPIEQLRGRERNFRMLARVGRLLLNSEPVAPAALETLDVLEQWALINRILYLLYVRTKLDDPESLGEMSGHLKTFARVFGQE